MVRSVSQFLNVKNICPAEMYCQLLEVYGESVMTEGNVSGGVCLLGKREMCTMKHNLDACLLSLRI
jgi:hypothetical protein